jgi:hypothetical protein
MTQSAMHVPSLRDFVPNPVSPYDQVRDTAFIFSQVIRPEELG